MHIGYMTMESPYDATEGGGIASYLRAVIPGMLQAGHRVTVLTNLREPKEPFSPCEGVNVISFRLPSLHWYISRFRLLDRFFTHPLRQMEWSRKFASVVRQLMAKDPLDVLESTELALVPGATSRRCRWSFGRTAAIMSSANTPASRCTLGHAGAIVRSAPCGGTLPPSLRPAIFRPAKWPRR